MKNKISHCERPIVWESAHCCCYYCRHYRHTLFCSPSRGNDYYSQLNVIPLSKNTASLACHVLHTTFFFFLYTKINQCSTIVLVIIIVDFFYNCCNCHTERLFQAWRGLKWKCKSLILYLYVTPVTSSI